MELNEQLKKTEKDLEDLDARKARYLQEHEQKRRRIQQRKREIEKKILEEKNSRIIQAFHENVGDATEENLEAFFQILQKGREKKTLDGGEEDAGSAYAGEESLSGSYGMAEEDL